MTNNKEKQIEISNYENERLVSNYVVSVLKEKNTLFAVEMHKKEGSKYEKVAFVQLVKDGFNYAKVHLKADKSLVYEVQRTVDDVYGKVRSVSKRHSQDISSIVREQFKKVQLEQQIDNISKLSKKARRDVKEIADEYASILRQYVPRVSELAQQVYESISDYLREAWNIKLDERISEVISVVLDQAQKIQSIFQQWKDNTELNVRRLSRQVEEMKDQFDHEVIGKLSKQLQENFDDVIRVAEQEGEKVYEFVRRNLKSVNLDKAVEKVKELIVKIKDQIKQVRVHENLRDLVNNYQQSKFEGKWDLRGDGEIIGKVYYPTKWIN